MRVLSTMAAIALNSYDENGNPIPPIPVTQIEEFLGGLVYGLIQKDDLKEIESCMTDADQVEKEVMEALNDIMKGDIEDILAGVEVIGTLLTELPADFKDCQATQADFQRISNWLQAIVADPLTFAKTVTVNLVKNFPKITDDISATSADIGKNDYYTAGEDISDILVLTVGPVPEGMYLY